MFKFKQKDKKEKSKSKGIGPSDEMAEEMIRKGKSPKKSFFMKKKG